MPSDVELLVFSFGLTLVAVGAHLGVFLVDGVEFSVAQLLNVHHLVLRFIDRIDQLVEFQVDGARVTVLRVLNDEDHEGRDDGRTGVDDQLPGVGVVKDRAGERPDDDDDDRADERLLEPSQLEAAAANLPKASP